MKKMVLLILSLPQLVLAQKWIDTTYQIQVNKDSVYGEVVDFAGNTEFLKLDIAYPTNDTPPSCGRPLVMILYGGAWMAGSKDVAEVQLLMHDFAKRGYVAVAPNYRLGMFQTSSQWNCNISALFNIEWNCLNAQDTTEWYRAYYRAIQDAKGAIRYMVEHKNTFQINVNNVFTTGFSAGAFTALGVAFLDHPSEWHLDASLQATAQAPNSIYNAGCVQKYGWDTSIASMNLARPSLGTLEGSLNLTNTRFKIKAVGNLYGGMLYNLLDSGSKTTAIYGFHQPNDLIVPYYAGQKVFHGLNACAYPVCNISIVNRPLVYSSPAIRNWAISAGIDMYFDSTKNNTDCLGQINDPSKGGHQLDHWNRTRNMATYFASKIDTTDCATLAVKETTPQGITVYPNPAQHSMTIHSGLSLSHISVVDMTGKQTYVAFNTSNNHTINMETWPRGMYILYVQSTHKTWKQKIILD